MLYTPNIDEINLMEKVYSFSPCFYCENERKSVSSIYPEVVSVDNVVMFSPLDKVNLVLKKFDEVEEENKKYIVSFLIDNFNVLDILNQSIDVVKRYFDEKALFKVGFIDNSVEDGVDQVYVLVKNTTNKYNNMKSFKTEWWIDKINQVNGCIVFRV